MTKTKKIIIKLACATVLGTAGVALTHVNMPQVTVNAAATSVAARALGVDVASYQSADLSSHAHAGAQFAIVKVSEGTSYSNPKASSQILTALSNNMMPMAYHFATFSSNSSAAVAEANYAIKAAQAFGLPEGSYIACDYETGQGNNIYGGKTPTANAIIAFMDQIKAAGYKPLLYASSSVLQHQIDANSVVAKYPNSLWVASYAISGRIDNPNFNYFPSMNGVSIWQFTDNWRGLNVDGNVAVLPLSTDGNVTSNNGAISQAPTNKPAENTASAKPASNPKPAATTNNELATSGYVMKKAYIYNKKGERQSGYYAAYYGIKYYGSTVKLDNGKTAIRVGDDRYVMASNVLGNSRVMKHNVYIYNHAGRRANWRILRKGTPVKTYGTRFHIHGKSYYRIGKGLYVKCANF
ncbi:SLAP domain-containing protein [Lactobacillus kefiranofaciens subsp. kefirgranum]|uniref:GH25 family lysozyme n=1 Tax=Lactobacillus kefiranofaciens TaxID=267818 RepID=UPI000BA691DC|nr:GH25 family lysozyme [Lactobacillus kefiranofaciens]MCJ2172036.1 SLAP domain-containing protein [Lactobacillus kefiranofaciens]MCP9330271.1 SLAP domain-containing protein [Lactobacillus kefiranofaciens]PAK98470.1 lysin [Lactobacillus kefiranofaciens]QNT44827.1 SLAP domain-containing protein [Lactobacillus kefiranofaciens]URW71769.1 SLAP domain-containing protein [Lactobacillus kefiranofaciens subsp. kefirgranum]